MILIVGQWLLHVYVIFAGPSSMSTIYIDHTCSVMSRHDVFNQVTILNIDSSDVQIDTSLCLLGIGSDIQTPVFVYWEQSETVIFMQCITK